MTLVHRLLPGPRPHAELRAAFRWPVPEHYNIAVDVCDRWAAAEPDRLALIHKRQDGTAERLSYGELARQSNRLANALQAAGLARGDRIGLLLPQCPETTITHLAAYKLGAVAVPLAALFGPDALEYRLDTSGAKGLVTDTEGLGKIGPFRDRLTALEFILSIDGDDGEARDLAGISADQPETFAPVATRADDPALMIFTSGTTGPPKGALHAHRVLLGHMPAIEIKHEFFPQDGDVMWTPADWAWAGGLLNIMLPALRSGVPVVAYNFRKFDPETAFDLMAEFGVRNTFIPPTALKMLRTVEASSEKFDLKLRTLASGGEALGKETLDWGRAELGLTINEFYGQTECNLVLSACGAIGVTRPGSIGFPVPGHDVAVIDPEGRVLPADELGQIAVRRPDPVMFLEYWGQPEATADKFIGDWLVTGDQGVVDGDGYFSFVGRDDDVITSAGYRIGPGEIEDCLLSHPAVKLAAAVGKPDPVRTEIVKAFIVLNETAAPSPALEDELRAHVRERLSAHEYPREIAFIDEMPLTTTGKVIRRLLREQV